MGIEITEGHHERWDGTGYPFARSGDNIPLSARIVALADVLDALTSKRPYKEALSFEVSASMIIGESGTHFDPRIIEVFQDNLDDFKNAYDGFKSENRL
jgi:HD-GYP domain-containing protein (c-di-GMP phosphodiesterase class II)